MHALSHVMKTRNLVISNKQRLELLKANVINKLFLKKLKINFRIK